MRFFHQLRQLMWKNFILRWRRKWQCLAEIVVPILLFTTFLGSENKKPNDSSEYHFKENAMPSTGQGPFFHSFVCNSRFTEYGTAPSPFYQSNKTTRALTSLTDILINGGRLKQINSKAGQLEELLARLNNKIHLPGAFVTVRDVLPESLWPFLGNISDVSLNRAKLNAALQRSRIQSAICAELADLCSLPDTAWKILAELAATYNESSVSEYMEPWEWLRLNALVADITKHQEEHRTLAETSAEVLEAVVSSDTTTPLCDSLDAFRYKANGKSLQGLFKQLGTKDPCYVLQHMPTYGLRWYFIKPFVMGKILYAPDTAATRKVMQTVNETFSSLLSVPGGLVTASSIGLPTRAEELEKLLSKDVGTALLVTKGTLGTTLHEAVRLLRSYATIKDAADPTPEQLFEYLLNFLKEISYNCINFDKVMAFPDEKSAQQEAFKLKKTNELWALVVFDNIGTDTVEPSVSYRIRMQEDRVGSSSTIIEKSWIAQSMPNEFLSFAYLQDMLDSAILSVHTGRRGDSLPGRTLQQQPGRPYHGNSLSQLVSLALPFLLVLSWTYSVSVNVKSIVYEKEERIKETLSAMGLSNAVHWAGWFIDCYPFMCISVVPIAAVLVFGNVLLFTNFWLMILLMLSYAFATLTFCFLVSTLFAKTTMASLLSGVIYFLTFLPYLYLAFTLPSFSSAGVVAMSLISNVAMGLGVNALASWEEQGITLDFRNWDSPPVPGYPISLSTSVYMLWVDAILYGILTWYIEAVWPGEYGVPKPFYFFLTKSYWFGTPDAYMSAASGAVYVPTDNLEAEPAQGVIGVSLDGLTKVFGKKTAVNGLSLNFYQDQITCFLGHNGAGKTTTISMLTGMFPPSKGTARVYGLDIRSDMDSIRTNMGICPQFNVLYGSLTVEEHLYFFGRIKGEDPQSLRVDIDSMLHDMRLADKRTAAASTLSGGMRRKLSVGMAFVGGSRTVFLDEPTAGVDPFSRRAIWELLVKYRKGRTVILTTHFMDEADLLGDRIAIISDGQLQCCGSSVFLKARFGSGYYLTVEMRNPAKVEHVQDLVQRFVPGAQLVKEVGLEAVFVLPDREDVNSITAVLDALDSHQDSVASYGVSDTPLEEIFLKTAASKEDSPPTESLTLTMGTPGLKDRGGTSPHLQGVQLLWSQFVGLSIKRLQLYRRSARFIFTQVLFPAAFLSLALFGLTASTSPDETAVALAPAQLLSPDLYPSPRAGYFEVRQDPAGVANPWTDKYVASMFKDGLGPSRNPSTKRLSRAVRAAQFNEENSKYDCTLADGIPSLKLSSGEIFYNVTGENVPQWLIDSFDNCMSNRFGGVTFGTEYPYTQAFAAALPSTFHQKADNVRIWYSPRGVSSSVVYQNAINNVLLRASIDASQSAYPASAYGISASNHPLPPADSDLPQDSSYSSSPDGAIYAVPILFVLSFVPASYISALIEDRVSQCKHLQLVSGLKRHMYWLQTYVCDMASYIVTVILIILVFVIFNNAAFLSGTRLLANSLLMLLFGTACVPLMYVFSWFFKVPSMAYVTLACGNLFVGIITNMILLMDDSRPGSSQFKIEDIFYILPQFCLGRGLINVASGYINGIPYDENSPNSRARGALDFEVSGRPLLAMALQTVVFLAATLIREYLPELRQRCWRFGRSPPAGSSEGDEDVQAERDRVASGRADSDMLVIKDLCKSYNSKQPPAVNRVSLGVRRGECFGLLGLNGAGKTTTFHMLTGATDPSSGDARVDGHSICGDMDSVRKVIGYCPQFEGLAPLLTVRQHLDLHCRLRGMTAADRHEAIDRALKRLNLLSQQHKLSRALSGGNKRKLSTAIALLGDPPLVFMDEPTTGMDPGARRFLWDCVLAVLDSGRSVVLTSHSMEECQALCTKLTIMVNGQLTCFGSPQHLKSKYGSGYGVTVRCPEHRILEARELVSQRLHGAAVAEAHLNQVKFHVPQTNEVKLAGIFRTLEDARRDGSVLDYSISQTTLEDVFMRFAQTQTPQD